MMGWDSRIVGIDGDVGGLQVAENQEEEDQ